MARKFLLQLLLSVLSLFTTFAFYCSIYGLHARELMFLIFTLPVIITAYWSNLYFSMFTAICAAMFGQFILKYPNGSHPHPALLVYLVEAVIFSGLITKQRNFQRQALIIQKQLEKEIVEKEILCDLGTNLTAKMPVREMVQAICDVGTKLTGAELGAYFYHADSCDGQSLSLHCLSGASEAMRKYFTSLPNPRLTDAIFATTLSKHKSLRSDDITADPLFGKNAPYFGIPRGHFPVKSYLAVPVISPTRVFLGAMFFAHSETSKFTDRHERIAMNLASQAAIAIDNVNLCNDILLREEQYRQLAEAMPQIVWTATVQGEIEYFNNRWFEYTGLDFNANGYAWETAIHPDDIPQAVAKWKNCIKTGEKLDIEERILNRDGEYHWHLVRAIPTHDSKGRITRWYGSCTDIMSHKNYEQQLQKAIEEAKSANIAKDYFLATLSHELRTPLTPVLASISLLMLSEELPTSVRDELDMIRRNVQIEAKLVDDILDVTRITRGKVTLDRQVLDLHELIMEVVHDLESGLSKKKLTVRTRFSSEHSCVNGDKARLRQVFNNLLNNAIKFSVDSGSISIATFEENENIVVEIKDGGIGIHSTVLPRLFNPFEQGEKVIGASFGGVGLGLSISKTLVEAHGGTIKARSEGRYKGSTFTVKLKTELLGVPAAPIEEVLNSEAKNANIILVEDHEDTSRIMARLLSKYGYKITTAASVKTAFEVIKNNRFDLLISDIGLPDGNGYDLLAMIKQAKIPLKAIALSGFGLNDDVAKSIEVGFITHITKPVDVPKLVNVITNVLSEPCDNSKELQNA